ncbi:aldose 1-epimerase family protein [Aquimarina sp. W85]|uniref:aldose 1-epimerase family protein n=1 Tax=Aquimarina rhodophyticola TaxID=3342246 RepID=UPI00366D7B36
MLHTIENENLICIIESKGAEIRSLKDKITGQEYIWQINPRIWGSSSPVLFPAIGNIIEGKILYDQKEYAMPKHGIIRNNDQLIFEKQGISMCAFTLKSSKKTRQYYPFEFTFTVKYTLVDTRLCMTYQITNNDSIPMHFVCGGHTAYACPISDEVGLSDYVVEFPEHLNLEMYQLASSGLLSHKKSKIQTHKRVVSLSDTIFDNDALIFSNIPCDWVRLRKKSDTKGIVVRFTGYPHLALWSKPSANFVCIEPWLGLPDRENESIELIKKTNYKVIEPNTKFTITIDTIIE